MAFTPLEIGLPNPKPLFQFREVRGEGGIRKIRDSWEPVPSGLYTSFALGAQSAGGFSSALRETKDWLNSHPVKVYVDEAPGRLEA